MIGIENKAGGNGHEIHRWILEHETAGIGHQPDARRRRTHTAGDDRGFLRGFFRIFCGIVSDGV